MLVVGLTGGIATGKSTVSNLLRAKGVPVVDADVLAREVVMPGTPAHANIVKHFGTSIVLPDGSLDRKKLGELVFNDAGQRRILNSIVHPAVRRMLVWQVITHWLRGQKISVVDVPLLIESGIWKWAGKIVVVSCSPQVELQRLMKRDGSSRKEAQSRLDSQLPITEKVAYADEVLDNSGTMEELEAQVDVLLEKLETEVGWTWRLSWLCPLVGFISAVWIITFKALKRRSRLSKSV